MVGSRGVSNHPLLGFDSFARASPRTQEITFYLLHYLFDMKGCITQKQPEGRDSQSTENGVELPCPLPVHHVFANLESSLYPVLSGASGDFIT